MNTDDEFEAWFNESKRMAEQIKHKSSQSSSVNEDKDEIKYDGVCSLIKDEDGVLTYDTGEFIYDTNTQLTTTTMNTFTNFAIMFILSLISGSFLSLASNIRTLLIDDAVELEYKLSGTKPTALFFSFQTAIIKIQSGVSSLISSAGYMLIGFTSAETAKLNEYIANGFVARESSQYTTLFTMLFFLFSVLPAVSSLLAVVPFVKGFKNKI